jgi:trigger factor
MKNNLIAVISAGSKVDIPNAMLDREINLMLDELRTSLTQTNLTLEDYLKGIKKEEKDLRKELEKSAEMRVKGKVVLKAIAAAEKIKVKEEEIEEEIKNLARAGGQSVEEMKKTLDKGGRGYVEEHLLRRKALDYAIEKADIKMVAAESGKEEKA